MPGAVTLTSTIALTNATLQYGLQIANAGLPASINANNAIKEGVNTYAGHLTQNNVAIDLDIEYTDLLKVA